MPSDGTKKAVEPRLVTVRRPGVEVGVTLCGGNLRGVYIESLDEDSPARGADGLLPGDLIMEVWISAFTYMHRYTKPNDKNYHNVCIKSYTHISMTNGLCKKWR